MPVWPEISNPERSSLIWGFFNERRAFAGVGFAGVGGRARCRDSGAWDTLDTLNGFSDTLGESQKPLCRSHSDNLDTLDTSFQDFIETA
jgi:hypothetical protein